MEDLIKALQIFLKYGNPHYPTNCEHDELQIDIDPELMSEEDIKDVDKLGFSPNGFNGFSSSRYGSY